MKEIEVTAMGSRELMAALSGINGIVFTPYCPGYSPLYLATEDSGLPVEVPNEADLSGIHEGYLVIDDLLFGEEIISIGNDILLQPDYDRREEVEGLSKSRFFRWMDVQVSLPDERLVAESIKFLTENWRGKVILICNTGNEHKEYCRMLASYGVKVVEVGDYSRLGSELSKLIGSFIPTVLETCRTHAEWKTFDGTFFCKDPGFEWIHMYARSRGYSVTDRIGPDSYIAIDVSHDVPDMLEDVSNDRIIFFCKHSGDSDYESINRSIFHALSVYPGSHMVHLDTEIPEKTVDSIIEQHEISLLSDFGTEVSVSSDRLSVIVNPGDRLSCYLDDIRFVYRLIRDGEVVSTSPRLSDSSYCFQMTGNGLYQAQVNCYNGDVCAYRRSDAVGCYDHIFKEAADKLMGSFSKYVPIRPVSKVKPFQNMALSVLFKIDEDVVKSECLAQSRTVDIPDVGRVTAYGEKTSNIGGADYFLSGFYRDGNKLVIDGSVGTLSSSSYGCFTCIRIDDSGVRFFKDLCSYGKIYMYQGREGYLFANDYYLLVRLLSSSGISLRIDQEKILTRIVSTSQYLLQNFSSEMDIMPIRQLDPCSQVVISPGSLNIHGNTEVFQILSDRSKISYDEYHKMLECALGDIRSNASAAMDTFGYVEEDLSGGADSRTVLSVVSSIDGARDNVRINTRGPEDLPDVRLGVGCASEVKMDFVEKATPAVRLEFDEAEMVYRNRCFGTDSSYKVNTIAVRSLRCRMTGGTGDALCRPEYSRHHFGKEGELSVDACDVAENIWQRQVASGCIATSYVGHGYFRKSIKNELVNVPGSLIRALDLQYFFFRNGYHFDPYPDYVCGSLFWMPLQSIHLLELYSKTHDMFRNSRLQMELINLADNNLASIEFENLQDNMDVLTFGEDLVLPVYPRKILPEMAKWKAANRLRRYVYEGNSTEEKIDYNQRLAEILGVFSKLDDGYYRDVCYDIVHYMGVHKGDQKALAAIYRKLLLVVDEYSALGKVSLLQIS